MNFVIDLAHCRVSDWLSGSLVEHQSMKSDVHQAHILYIQPMMYKNIT